MDAVSRYAAIEPEKYRTEAGADLAAAVAAGTVSPVQLVECALAVAEGAEPTVNAYASLLRDRALREAADLEAEARTGRIRGPLHGVPIAVKDNFHYAGEPTGKGSLTTSVAPEPVSAPMVDRLVRAGAIVIGKTTTPEFGWKGTGISPRTGITRNPRDPQRNSGGSSAGSGATVATGAVPIATGTDAGGSIRIPASFCGVVGFKPTLGAIPVWPGTANETLSHAGPLTGSVRDAALVYALTRGADSRDPQSAYPDDRRDAPGRALRIGIVDAPFGIAPQSPVAAVFERATAAIISATTHSARNLRLGQPVAAEFGAVEFVAARISIPLPRSVFEAMWVTGRGLGHAGLIEAHADVMDPGLVRLLPLARRYSLAEYQAAMVRRREFTAAMFALFDDWDLLVMPTMPGTAFAADAEVPPGGEADAPLPWITWTPYTYPFNITGQPAISIPGGTAADGLPVGLQIVGPWGHDRRVLAFAAACEHALRS
ncbi:amidase [Nocardia aurantia]|uniref:amidase n=1 Tax=Nocardia aurantia TaxID=2585199 RepID=A0A7K0DJI7_9NOCA|nr:amidase family protein [Nocardia aurantia]MQY25817.1 Acylamidase [Nocardia aurantia]